jgi:hypothetical protein
VADLYYHAILIAPGGSCQSVGAAVLGRWKFWLNDVEIDASSGGSHTLGPDETEIVPAISSLQLRGLLPGHYDLETGGFGTVQIAPDCVGTVLKTEVYVVTVASA